MAWIDAEGLHYGPSLQSTRVVSTSLCDRVWNLALAADRILVGCEVVSTVPGSSVIEEIRVELRSYSPAGELKELGAIGRDPRREPPLAGLVPDGTHAFINGQHEVMRRRFDAFAERGDEVFSFGNDWYVLSIAKLGEEFLTEIHDCPMEAACSAAKHELHLVRRNGSATKLGPLPDFVGYRGMVATRSHALIPVGRRLFHTAPEGPLLELTLNLPPRTDAGSDGVGAALSDCGAVAVAHSGEIRVRGVQNW